MYDIETHVLMPEIVILLREFVDPKRDLVSSSETAIAAARNQTENGAENLLLQMKRN